jgi:hypothetical protein
LNYRFIVKYSLKSFKNRENFSVLEDPCAFLRESRQWNDYQFSFTKTQWKSWLCLSIIPSKNVSILYCVEDCKESMSALIFRYIVLFNYDFQYTKNNDYKDYWIFNVSNNNRERSFNTGRSFIHSAEILTSGPVMIMHKWKQERRKNKNDIIQAIRCRLSFSSSLDFTFLRSGIVVCFDWRL